jgi:hypothetical protein
MNWHAARSARFGSRKLYGLTKKVDLILVQGQYLRPSHTSMPIDRQNISQVSISLLLQATSSVLPDCQPKGQPLDMPRDRWKS